MGKRTRKQSAAALAIAPTAEERLARINKIVEESAKAWGSGAVGTLEGEHSIRADVVGYVSTGSMGLNEALGVGGLPKGRIVEIYGAESSGKTTLSLHAIAECQKMGGLCAFIDAEHALDPSYAEKLGVNLSELLLSQPSSGEQALEIAETLISSGVDVVVIDSVAALVPKAELEGDMGDMQPGLQARLMSQAMRKLTGKVHTTDTLVIFINQIRMKIGVKFGSPKTTSGGQALKFYSSVRLEVARIGGLKKGDDNYGNRTRVTVRKNKVAPPFKTAEFDIVFGIGIDSSGELLDYGVAYGIVKKSGAWYSRGDERLGHGRQNAIEYLREVPKMADEIREAVLKKKAELES
jgi:recombination protein RecA